MAELTPDIVADVIDACTKGADEAAEAIGRGLDCTGAKIAVGEPGTIHVNALPETLAGPGLVVVLTVGQVAALAILPESSGLTPSWCANPDPTGQSKLTTLAQELGMVLLPEAFMPDDFKAGYVKDLSAALTRGGMSDGAAMVPLGLALESKTGVLSLVWPAVTPAAVLAEAAESPPVAKPKPAAKSQPTPKPPSPAAEAKPTVVAARTPRAPSKTKTLPPYSQSLLKIRVPVVVTLAEKNVSRSAVSWSWGPARLSSLTSRARKCSIFRWATIASPTARPSRWAKSLACGSPRWFCPTNGFRR